MNNFDHRIETQLVYASRQNKITLVPLLSTPHIYMVSTFVVVIEHWEKEQCVFVDFVHPILMHVGPN